MKLIKLYSENKQFRTINFNPGLTIVVGLKLSEEEKHTYNGVGKSLSLTLVHLILGARFLKDQDKLKKFLGGYGMFHLSIEIAGRVRKFSKDFSKTCFYIDGEEKNKNEYKDALNSIFNIGSLGINFRQAFNCAARRFGDDYYSNALTQQSVSITDYRQRYINLKLLGIDTELVERKCDIKDKIKKNEGVPAAIKKYMPEEGSTKLNDIIDSIEDLNKGISDFRIAENYDRLKKDAEVLTADLNEYRDRIYSLEGRKRRNLENLNLIQDVKIDPQDVIKIYNEALYHFEDKVIRRLEDAQQFHTTLLRNRRDRIKAEIKTIDAEIGTYDTRRSEISMKRDNLLRSLENAGAIEEYNALIVKLRNLEKERDEIEKYEKMIFDLEKERYKLKAENSIIQSESLNYIEKTQEDIKEKEGRFRSIVRRFYDTTGGALNLVQTRDAKYLYDIHVHIPRDESQGIGEVKIFCYDALLYVLNRKMLNFLAHDGCLFSEMDPRPKAMIFKIVLGFIQEYDLQYFVNISENSLKEILDEQNTILTPEEKIEVQKGVCLRLNDLKPENWLFGIAFD